MITPLLGAIANFAFAWIARDVIAAAVKALIVTTRRSAPKIATHEELRAHRRKFVYRPLLYDADFHLTAEVRAIVGPVAQKLATEPCPASSGYVDAVEAFVEAVAHLLYTTARPGPSAPDLRSPDRQGRVLRSQTPTAATTSSDEPEAARRPLADVGIDMEYDQYLAQSCRRTTPSSSTHRWRTRHRTVSIRSPPSSARRSMCPSGLAQVPARAPGAVGKGTTKASTSTDDETARCTKWHRNRPEVNPASQTRASAQLQESASR